MLENAKNLGRSDDAKRRKKRGWPIRSMCDLVFAEGEKPADPEKTLGVE